MRVPLRPCLPALHYRHLHGPLTLYAELIRFPIYGRYRRQAFDLQVSLLEVLRAQTELQTERRRLQTLSVHLGDVGPLQELRVDLIEGKRKVTACIFSTRRRDPRRKYSRGDRARATARRSSNPLRSIHIYFVFARSLAPARITSNFPRERRCAARGDTYKF